MTTQAMTKPPARAVRRRFMSLPAAAGIGYSVAWIISLSAGAPNPSVAAPGAQVVAAFAGHGGPAMTMFALAEGAAAAALAIVVLSVARAARRCGARLAGLAVAGFGIAAAVVSWIELGLGAWLIGGLVPGRRAGTAGAVYHAITRIDGAKMFLLAAMAVAVSAVALKTVSLPRRLAPLGFLLAASLAVSGLGYILLAPGLASAVYVSGILLLVFVSATGITLRSRGEDDARAQAGRTSRDADVIGAGRPGTRATAAVADMPPGAVTRNAGDKPARS